MSANWLFTPTALWLMVAVIAILWGATGWCAFRDWQDRRADRLAGPRAPLRRHRPF